MSLKCTTKDGKVVTCSQDLKEMAESIRTAMMDEELQEEVAVTVACNAREFE